MTQSIPAKRRIPYERVWVGCSRLKAVIALTHPTAVILFSLITWILVAITSFKLSTSFVSLAIVLSMAAAQASVGVFNEVFDWKLDKETKPWRAIPAGIISLRSATIMAIAFFCLSLVLSALVSFNTMFLLISGAGIGILYSAKLKRTVLSWLPYIVNYPSFPVWVLVALGRFNPQVLSIYPQACLFAIAVHTSNQMRDYDEDERMGVRGLVQHIGKNRAVSLCFALQLLSPLPFLFTEGLECQPVPLVVWGMITVFHWLLTLPLLLRAPDPINPAVFRSLFRRLQISGPLMLIAWYWFFTGRPMHP